MIFSKKKPTDRQRTAITTGRSREPRQRLAPSAPNRAFSYYSNRSQTEQTTGREALYTKPAIRRLPTRFQRLRQHAGWFVGVAAVLALTVYQLQLSTTPKIVSLAASSDAPFLQDAQIYQQAGSQLFNASAANRNKLTVNATDIAAQMQRQFPELQEVAVSLPIIGATPTLLVRPAEPALVLTAANGTYVVDTNGRALAEATAGTNLSRLKVPTVTDQSSLQVRLGTQVLPRTATAFISSVTSQLAAQQLTVKSMTLPAAAGELDVYIANSPYFIKFNLQEGGAESAAKQAGRFVAVIKQLSKAGTQPTQYVDVRLDGRAYYK